jgi:hypothetical protein
MTRVMCQCCRRMLVPLKDGTARNHVRRRGAEDYCQGSGYRLARWEVDQRLRHHSGGVWEIAEDIGGEHGDYLLRCVFGTRSFNDPDRWLEHPGKTMRTHGEYMHRHGWTPVADTTTEAP